MWTLPTPQSGNYWRNLVPFFTFSFSSFYIIIITYPNIETLLVFANINIVVLCRVSKVFGDNSFHLILVGKSPVLFYLRCCLLQTHKNDYITWFFQSVQERIVFLRISHIPQWEIAVLVGFRICRLYPLQWRVRPPPPEKKKGVF